MVEHEHTGPVDTLTWTFSRIVMWAPAFIVAIIFYEVFMRYILFQPTLWVNEMSLWVAGAIYLTAGLYSMQQRSHIRIFVLYDMAPLWLRRAFDVASVICVCIFAFAMVWGGYGEALAKFWRWETFGTAFDPPIPATNKPLVLVTMFFLAFQAVSNIIRDWPSVAWLRKLFDIVSVALIIWLVTMALPAVLATGEAASKVPMHWRVAMVSGLLGAVIVMLIGLMRDFNRTPVGEPEWESPEEEFGVTPDIPDEVLTGDPPKPH